MKVYTKTGDKGKTSLIGGTRVPKYHERIEAYGTVDELISHIGLIRDLDSDKDRKQFLIAIQDRLMTCASILATDCDNCKKIPVLNQSDIEILEAAIDFMEEKLEPLKSFILPGGNVIVSESHIARCVCRRAERIAVKLAETTLVDFFVIQYLNRLSDYLFVLARFYSKKQKVEETPWFPKY